MESLTDDKHLQREQPARHRRPVDWAIGERDREHADQSFTVTAAGIAAQNYDLSINRYKQVIGEISTGTREIITELRGLSVKT